MTMTNAEGTTRKELVFRYLTMDETLRPCQLMARLKDEHKQTMSDSQATHLRKLYFSTIGKTCPKIQRGSSSFTLTPGKSPTPPGNFITELRAFRAAIKAVGGTQAAKELLDILS